MTPLQLELTKLIGKQELSLGCIIEYIFDSEPVSHIETIIIRTDWDLRKVNELEWNPWVLSKKIIWHPATLSDLHRWMNENFRYWFEQIHREGENYIVWYKCDHSTVYMDGSHCVVIPYDSSKELLEQETSTLEQIISLIKQ